MKHILILLLFGFALYLVQFPLHKQFPFFVFISWIAKSIELIRQVINMSRRLSGTLCFSICTRTMLYVFVYCFSFQHISARVSWLISSSFIYLYNTFVIQVLMKIIVFNCNVISGNFFSPSLHKCQYEFF